ncbi:hypothetical protein [Nocardia wallacei]|uniref:Uncharacterized protein n=1 Tax=Nocardia wallacei TaxID=480035 RepID=A0A7G1KEB6_9NOCA|nr:hypothetical protein [Nocardia wallacei]BCK53340.1 hypothetical protein NWFMUON74_11120 [Nocardia wallacei]
MDTEEAIEGAWLVAADIENSLGRWVLVETGYPDGWREFHAEVGREVPGAGVRDRTAG